MEDGHERELISTGIIAEDGRMFYKQVVAADYALSNDFVFHTVIPALAPCPSGRHKRTHWALMSQPRAPCPHAPCPWAWKAGIAKQLQTFVGDAPTFLG